MSEKWSEIFPQEQDRRGMRMDDKSWISYLRSAASMDAMSAMCTLTLHSVALKPISTGVKACCCLKVDGQFTAPLQLLHVLHVTAA